MFVPHEHSWIFEPRLSTRRDRGSPNMKMKTYLEFEHFNDPYCLRSLECRHYKKCRFIVEAGDMTVQVYRPSVCNIVQSGRRICFTAANHRLSPLCATNQRQGLGASIWQTNKIRKATQTAQNRKIYGKTNSASCLGISDYLQHPGTKWQNLWYFWW